MIQSSPLFLKVPFFEFQVRSIYLFKRRGKKKENFILRDVPLRTMLCCRSCWISYKNEHATYGEIIAILPM